MRKLKTLKSLVDYIWYITCIPLVPLMVFFVIATFFKPSIVKFVIDISDEQLASHGVWLSIFAILLTVVVYASIYCFHLFRKTLCFFEERDPFNKAVINIYSKIGWILIVIGIFAIVAWSIFRMVLLSEVKLGFGVSPYLTLICLGLFFMVLSETFLIAKRAKEENELTV